MAHRCQEPCPGGNPIDQQREDWNASVTLQKNLPTSPSTQNCGAHERGDGKQDKRPAKCSPVKRRHKTEPQASESQPQNRQECQARFDVGIASSWEVPQQHPAAPKRAESATDIHSLAVPIRCLKTDS